MQPIKTTNAMNPAPAKGVESFPTPVIDDVVISEIVNSWKGDYQPLEYGTLWKDVSHAPNQGSFPEHKLVFQQPTSEDGQWVKRIWVNDRVNQDSYNYAIKYSAGSQEHPIYIRTYIVPREGYAPLPDGTPDPLFPIAVLVDEEVTRNEGELDSKYITVTRIYETLPGPQVPTKRYNERGDLETVLVQTVPPNTPPDPDGLLVTESQVVQEEMGKGVKTTATVQDHSLLQIKEKKEGLLGETITTDDIVDPSTSPDNLSQTIVASTVEQYTATKARKRTTTASGPTSLAQKSKDGKLLGDITSTESVVAPNANPDEVSSTILSSEVRQVDSGKAIKRNIVLNSTPTLSGNQNEQGLLGTKSTTESIVSAGNSADPLSLSVISSSVEPIDSVRSRKVTVTSSGPLSLSGGQNKDGLLGQTNVDESIVAAGTPPDSLTQSIVSSVVEPIDAAKSKKITITSTGPSSLSGGQKKEGLLGETDVVESIVAAGTQPDTLSQFIVSSVVEPIDSAKSRKITITSTGPDSLTESSNDGKLLGDTTSTESIVAPNTIPDAPSATILSSQVKQLDSGKAVKTNIVLNSTPTLIGGQAGEGLLGTRDTTETIVPSGTIPDEVSLTVISSQVEPIDSVRSRKITIESTGPTSLSGAQKKEGLLGETNIEESIVSAGAQPDALSETIVSSIIEPIDSAKSKKITITSTGPSSLEQRNKDGKLLGDITSVKSVVGPNDLPDNPDASILSSEVNQIDSGKAIKTNVVLNSTPTLSGKQSEQGLLGVKSTVESIVPAGTPEDPLSLSVISSSVEPIDSVRSRRITIESSGPTTLSGGQNKEGLLGETDVVESIVAAGDSPDSLSQTVVSSVVEPIDSAKSRKVTITATGPTSLSQKSKDGKLLGDITSTESVVAPNADPDAVSSTIIASEVKQVDSGKAIKRNVVLNSTPTLSGNQNEQGLLGIKSTTERIVAAGTSADSLSLSVISSVVEPIDSVRSRKVTVTSSGPLSLSGGQNKDGLLGETTVNESIVAAGALPDTLSQTVVSSVVEPIDAAKSRKVTITSSGPNTLTQKSKDGKLLGDVTSTESIVAPNTNPDQVSSTILSSEVKQLDSGKAIKRNVVLNSTSTLSGGQSGDGLLGTKTTTETIVPSGTLPDDVSLTVLSSVVEPIDSIRSRKVTIESSGPTTLLGGQKKEGLLGETEITEEVVPAGTQPDALTQSVVSSVVEQIDSAKSRKVTITSTGPTSLAESTKDGKLLGDVIATESIVAPDTIPDAPSSTILSSQVKQLDSGKAVKTNVVLNSIPTLSGGQSGVGLLGTKDTVETIVAAGAPPDAVSLTVISSSIEPIDSVRSRKVTIESSGPTSLETTSLVDSAVGQVPATVSQSIVPPSTTPAGGKFILQDQISAIDEAKAKREKVVVSAYPELTTYDLDEQLDVVIINERAVIDHNTPYVAPPLVLTSNDRPIDQWKTLRITSRLANLPPTRTEYKTQQFTFPAILDGVTVNSLNLGFGRVPISVDESEYRTGINQYVSVQPVLRTALSIPTSIRTVTTFYSSQPVPDPIFQISTQNVSFNGSLFGFNFGDVICDSISIGPIIADTYDMKYSGLSESVSFPASIPSRSAYNLLIGTEVVTFSDVEYHRAGIWFKRTGYVTLK